MEGPMCPREGVDLQETEIKHETVVVMVDACPSCRGVWFDRGELGLLTSPRVELELQTLHSGKDSITNCPRCRGRLVISSFNDVRADVCTRCCGIWLNRAEYVAITRGQSADEERRTSSSPGSGAVLEVRAAAIPPGVDLLTAIEDAFSGLGIANGAVLAASGPLLEAELLAPAEAGAQGAERIGTCQLISAQGMVVPRHERLSLVLHAVVADSRGGLRAGTLTRARTRGSIELVVAGVVRKDARS